MKLALDETDSWFIKPVNEHNLDTNTTLLHNRFL